MKNSAHIENHYNDLEPDEKDVFFAQKIETIKKSYCLNCAR